MNYYIDNDVVIKLAQYDLLQELTQCLSHNGNQFFVLETLYYVARLNDLTPPTMFDSTESGQRALDFYNSCKKAEITSTQIANLIQQIDTPNLDEGELILIGCAMENGHSPVVTGDKRAVYATDQLANSIVRLQTCKFIILERALRFILKHCDHNVIFTKIQNKPDIDKALSICFKNNGSLSLEDVNRALDSYINHEKSRCQHISVI